MFAFNHFKGLGGVKAVKHHHRGTGRDRERQNRIQTVDVKQWQDGKNGIFSAHNWWVTQIKKGRDIADQIGVGQHYAFCSSIGS